MSDDGRTLWYPEDAGWLGWERVVILGDEFGPAAVSVLAKLKCEAKLQNAGWRVKAGWRSLARGAFVDDVDLVHRIIERAGELGVLDDLESDDFNFTCKVSGMAASEKKARAAGRQQAARDRAQPTDRANVTERDGALRDVTTGDGPSPTEEDRTEEDNIQGERERGPADNLAHELALIVVAGNPGSDDLEHLRSFAAYAISQGVQDAQLLAGCAKDPRPASMASNAALVVRDAQAGGQTAAWEQLANAVVAGDIDPAATERWENARPELKDAAGDALFDVWLAPLTALSIDGDALVLGGPGATVDWINDRFARVLTDIVGPVRLIPVLEAAAA